MLANLRISGCEFTPAKFSPELAIPRLADVLSFSDVGRANGRCRLLARNDVPHITWVRQGSPSVKAASLFAFLCCPNINANGVTGHGSEICILFTQIGREYGQNVVNIDTLVRVDSPVPYQLRLLFVMHYI
ncbi:hypothetical protein BSY18_4140 (plasmid) [Blastomonas sp. RAC04]|nr:hypothetical protein BSY18_4140 [Blastomonas sp. RAC04]